MQITAEVIGNATEYRLEPVSDWCAWLPFPSASSHNPPSSIFFLVGILVDADDISHLPLWHSDEALPSFFSLFGILVDADDALASLIFLFDILLDADEALPSLFLLFDLLVDADDALASLSSCSLAFWLMLMYTHAGQKRSAIVCVFVSFKCSSCLYMKCQLRILIESKQ